VIVVAPSIASVPALDTVTACLVLLLIFLMSTTIPVLLAGGNVIVRADVPAFARIAKSEAVIT
jgi:hypothetical protein